MEKEQLIQIWLNNELTPEELEAFKALEDHQFYMDIVENAKQFKIPPDTKMDDFETFNQKVMAKKTKSVRPLWANPFLRVASVLVIVAGLYFAFFSNPTTKVSTLAQQKTTIELPDTSLVTLNALSEVEFDKKNWDKNRKINLRGEAFFKVQKGKIFDVITSEGTVTVVGTEFSVKQRSGYFEVKCYEGIVKVTTQNTSQTLTSGKTYRVLDGEISQSLTELHAPQWLQHISNFEAVPFSEVTNELERQYDIEIQMENIHQDPLFSGGFVHNNLDNALMSITQPLNLNFKIISSKQVVIYGHKK